MTQSTLAQNIPPAIGEDRIIDDLEFDDMAPTDRSRTRYSSHHFAKALPASEGAGFTAQYSAPGLMPARVRGADGEVQVFGTEFEAELAASRALISVLNSRARSLDRQKDHRYEKMAPADLATAMAEINLAPDFLAYLKGTNPDRVLKWLQDEDDIPHDIRVLLAIFTALPESIDVAEKVTDANTTLRRPDRR